MRLIWRNKFIFWNVVALIFVKAIFSYSGLQFANIMDGAIPFAKEEVIAQTNIFRSYLGLGKLTENSTLDAAAAQKLQDMISKNYFAHTSPAGTSPWYWIEKSKYNYTYAGENLAIGFMTAKDTVDAWSNSPSHRKNLANSNYKEIGVAVAPANIQGNEGFLVVQLFGTPKPAANAVTKPQTTPKPTPVITPRPTLTATPLPKTPVPTATIQTAKEAAAEVPVTVTMAASTPTFNKVSKTLNFSLILYLLIASLASLVLAMGNSARKDLVVKTAVSFGLLVLAIIIPVVQLSHTAVIL